MGTKQAPQIPSPKSRQNCKQPPPQTSPTQHKYVSPYQTVNNQQAAQIQPRYPAPIQRPVNFQPTLNNSLQGSGNVGQRHRPAHNQNSRGPQQKQYYGGQGGGMQGSQADKSDDSKLIENGSSVSASNSSVITSSAVTKAVGNTGSNQNSDQSNKDSVSKDETLQNKE